MEKQYANQWSKRIISLLILFCCVTLFCFPCVLIAKKHKKTYVSATAIFCNEAPYLREWIEYYRLMGVEHFYLYNNLSTDHYQQELAPYIEQGIVDLVEWSQPYTNWQEWDSIQVAAYRDVIARAKDKTKWLAIMDIDEFFVPVKMNSLKSFLKKCEHQQIGGICCMWSFFGTSHIEKIPEDRLMIESLVYHSGPACNGEISSVWNQGAYKSIVQPEFVSAIISPHYCCYVEGKRHEMLSYDLIHINHYWTRDNDFFLNVKIPRRQAWGQDSASALDWAKGMNVTKKNNAILRFIPQLREKMGLSNAFGKDQKDIKDQRIIPCPFLQRPQ